MSSEPQLFRINPESKESERITEVDFRHLGLRERWDIQEWIATNPGILGGDLLIIEKEFSGFDRTNERLDLLAVDADGKLVIIELKRDDTGADAHWQAIKYASYLHRASAEEIVNVFANYLKIQKHEAEELLLEHIESDNLDVLNNDQRIILASHRFAPEVTSAALWLNEKGSNEDLITCIQLTPHRDPNSNVLYIQSNTIIPVPGIDDYIISIEDSTGRKTPIVRRKSSTRTSNRNVNDEITKFLRQIREQATGDLPQDSKPDNMSKHAGSGDSNKFRYYRLWYSRPPWKNEHFYYYYHLEKATIDSEFTVFVGFLYRAIGNRAGLAKDDLDVLKDKLHSLNVPSDYERRAHQPRFDGIRTSYTSASLDDAFADTLADAMRKLIMIITPAIDEFEAERNEVFIS